MALEPSKLSDFKMTGALGEGATAKVYEAVHLASGRSVAIKIMATGKQTTESRERFAREALLLADVRSRHVSGILGFGFERGRPFLVLERLRGETLDVKLRRDGTIPTSHVGRWVEQLLVGLRDCHDAKVIHRDIKPANLFLHRDGPDEIVKLIDFGVARFRESHEDVASLTAKGHLLGSMAYMAPEQFENAKTVSYPADLYAAGVVVFRMLTGQLPFGSRPIERVIEANTRYAVPLVSSMPGMIRNPLLDRFVLRALRREPWARFQSAREMLEEWRDVTLSLDEESLTDVTRGRMRMDDSHAWRAVGTHGLGSRRGDERSPNAPPERAPPEPKPLIVRDDRADEEQTSRRAQLPRWAPAGARTSDKGRRAPSPKSPKGAEAEERRRKISSSSHLPEPDPFDVPTRNDPNLRKLVDRELELHRARRRPR